MKDIPPFAARFLLVAALAAVFGAALFLLPVLFPSPGAAGVWWRLLWGPALLAFVLGNGIAVSGRGLRRTVFGALIAHAGLLLVALAAFGAVGSGAGGPGRWLEGGSAVPLALAAFAFPAAGALGAAALAGGGPAPLESLEDLAGLSRRRPVLAAATALFLLSLAGLPPLSGFVARWAVLRSVVFSGVPVLIGAALLGAAASLGLLYACLRAIAWMYFREPAPGAEDRRIGFGEVLAIASCAAATIVLGVAPNSLMRLAEAVLMAAMDPVHFRLAPF